MSNMINDSQTLSEHMAAGRMPASEALGYAVQIGDALRRLHDAGGVHGALTPAAVLLTPEGVRLLPGEAVHSASVTPYLAPERIRGDAPDACADIFSFGAVAYEMLTGRPPFQGDTPEALAESVGNVAPPPIGHPSLDRLIGICLSKDRGARWQRIQQAVIELRLLAGAGRRSEPGVVARHAQVETTLRAEIRQLESRMTSRLDEQRRVLEETCDALHTLCAQLDELDGRVAAGQEVTRQLAVLADKVPHLEQTVNAQAVAIERACNGIARTDDLVESVVEALESLQGLVLEQSEERALVAG
jgi:hypothetical protein